MRKLVCILCALFLLVGCHKVKDTVQVQTSQDFASMSSFDDTFYRVLNKGGSELRENFYLQYGTSYDFQSIGRGLQILSSSYFSTSDYFMSEGQYMSASLSRQLLLRSSQKSKYPYSLQPQKGREIEGIKEPIMVSKIQEQDYYKKTKDGYQIAGVSFSLVIDPRDKDDQRLVTPMSDQTIMEYGKSIIPIFYQFIQETKEMNDIKNLPILVTVYQSTTSSMSSVNGHYILECLCDRKLGKIQDVQQQTVIFSSQDAGQIDKTTSADFDIIKNNLKQSAVEAAGFVGIGQYLNERIQSMVIEAHLNVKTYSELLFLTSLIADQIDSQFTYDFDIKVLVNSQDDLQAIILKEDGQKATSHILY